MKPRYNHVRKKARELLETAGVRDAPVPVDDLARQAGAEISFEPFDDGVVDGMLMRQSGRTIIGVNALNARVRQRFTIAHELGHLVLHPQHEFHVDKRYTVRFRNDNSSTGEDPAEVEANQFAAELLMPRDFVDRDWAALPDDLDIETAIAQLARRYGVSVQAMTIRLGVLGLVKVAP